MPVTSAVRPMVAVSPPSCRAKGDRQRRCGSSVKVRLPAATSAPDDVAQLSEELEHAEDVVRLLCIADLCLKKGDDAALYALGFSQDHVADLRSRRDSRPGYPAYAMRNARWQVQWLRKRLLLARQLVSIV